MESLAGEPHDLTIEVVEWLPSGGGTGLVRVRGRWSAPDRRPAELPVLVATREGEDFRHVSLPDPRADREPGVWRAAFIVRSELVEAGCGLVLELDGGACVDLPDPERGLAEQARRRAAPQAPDREGGEVIDRAVLAERRARRAEAAEQAQARIAAEALKAVEVLELRGAELERRIEALVAEQRAGGEAAGVLREQLDAAEARALALRQEADDARAGRSAAEQRLAEAQAAGVRERGEAQARLADAIDALERREAELGGALAEAEARAEDRTRALGGALGSASDLRDLVRDWRLRLRSAEVARTGEAVRLAVLEAGRAANEAEVRAARAALAGAREETAAAHAAAQDAREALDRELAAVHRDLSAARAELAAARADAAERPQLEAEVAALRRELAAVRSARDAAAEPDGPAARIAELERHPTPVTDPAGLARRAEALARTASAPPPPATSPAGLLADLDAAAAALRDRAPVASPAAGGVAGGDAAEPPQRAGPRLRDALVKLAHDDPGHAARLLAGLLPAQAAALRGAALDYDLVIAELGAFAVRLGGGVATVRPLRAPRGRGAADFRLAGAALPLAELLAGCGPRPGRLRGSVRLTGRHRRRAWVLVGLTAAAPPLAEAARAGARLEPGDVLAAFPYAIRPSWTRGHAFTVLHEVTGEGAWLLSVADGAGVEVARAAGDATADARVTMSRVAWDALLRREPAPRGERPCVRGDRMAVAVLKAWTDRAQGEQG